MFILPINHFLHAEIDSSRLKENLDVRFMDKLLNIFDDILFSIGTYLKNLVFEFTFFIPFSAIITLEPFELLVSSVECKNKRNCFIVSHFQI